MPILGRYTIFDKIVSGVDNFVSGPGPGYQGPDSSQRPRRGVQVAALSSHAGPGRGRKV